MVSKKRSIIAIGAVMALGLTSCSTGADEGGSNGEGGGVSGEISFATWQFLEPNRGDQILDSIQGYTDASDVAVSPVEIARADYETQLSTQFGAGEGPDVFVIPDAFFPQLVDAGILEPLDDAIAAAAPVGYRDTSENYAVDGTQFAVVWEVVPYALYWNKNVLEEAGVEPPTNVDELTAAAEQIKESTGTTGFTVRHQMNEEAPWWTDYSNWAFGYGGEWSDGENLTIDSPENIEALTAFQQMTSSSGFGTGQDASTYRSAFAEGELGMSIDNSSAVLTQVSDTVPADAIGSALLPFPGGGSAFAGFSVGVNANSDNKDAALDFITWMLSEPAQQELADTLFPSAIATEVLASDDLMNAHPWTEAFFEQVNDSTSVVIPGFEDQTAEIRTIILTQVASVVSGGADPAEALATAQQQAESLG